MVITLKVGEKTKKEMDEFYQDSKREKTPAYAIFQANSADSVITLYQSGKAVFQGKSADIDAQLWKEINQKYYPNMKQEEKKEKKKKKEITKRFDANVIGSDEVGTGDFFGPLVVTSAFVSKKDIAFLEDLGVVDSKKLTDDFICKIAPKLMERITYKTIVLTNQDYNDYYSQDVNMNTIKAILHNKVLLQLKNKIDNYQAIVVDQFTTPKSYYNYLKDSKAICQDITFLEKGESKSLAVACAAIISRYFFIKKMTELRQKYNTYIPYGSNEKVDQVAVELAKKHGIDELKKLVKWHFKNLDKVKTILNEKE